MSPVVAAMLVLAVGTYAFRLTGPVLHGRVEIPVRVRELLAAGAVVLLVALLATGALTEAGGFAGWARPAGVLVGGVLAWRRAPFVVVVLGAAVTTAVLRAVGVA
ncbi:AzlD domain-containing protein [Streptomyces ipomoeae]|uniref:Branched-chain amino acid transport protein n=2 Tax=Streptomyces ipomoeae TaxID=103232 RepID=L1KI61_9ACTN|nr:AzlD domain-containing protein [Streptomyces ipomoeae]EKX60496.1 branched-chain amino acid transport protein [Streptomyces ipomoeae 91-03]MDX2700321.1 AzlD domain-containing protein [Streptomyces ipomoeae]MDX2844172.1 AzlD domain-containing protein [Streptomyces ipomoeae]MDX2935370.1 AzlD domain-containing protein [Streptomyces ipomoeae]TQE19967.1 AzlD domain-containing protein [Streptomyces ipomoeae]